MFSIKERRYCTLYYYPILTVVLIVVSLALNPEILNADLKVSSSIENTIPVSLTRDVQDRDKYYGTFRIYLLQRDQWISVGELSFNHYFTTQDLELKRNPANGRVRFKMIPEGGGAAHIDNVFVNGKPPTWINVPDLNKISKKDFDVIGTDQKPVEVTFDASTITTEKVTLSLTARIESDQISKVPFHFPKSNTFRKIDESALFYSYKLDSTSGKLTLDGDLNEEKLGEALFTEFVPVGSGHPQSETFGWVLNDQENLYVAIDFTLDNTRDDDKDYAKVYIKTADGIKDFTVSMSENTWGKPGFIYTDRVTWQHKVYEFAIPLNKIVANIDGPDNNDLQLAFAAYGTGVPSGGEGKPSLAYDSNHNQFLVVYVKNDPNSDIYGQFLDPFRNPIGSSFPIGTGTDTQIMPMVAFDPVNNRFLVVWSDSRNTNYDIYGQLVNTDGTLHPTPGDTTTNFPICTALYSQDLPDISFDTTNERFLAVWRDYRSNTNYDIYGQFINENGSLYPTPGDTTANFPVSTASNYQEWPSLAYDSDNSRFIVVWQDNRSGTNDDIYGQLINADGTYYPTPSDTTSEFPISTNTNSQREPSVAFDSINNRFLVVWSDFRASNNDIYGQLIDGEGELFPSPGDPTVNIPICTDTSNQVSPDVTFNSVNRRFLAVWHDFRDGSLYGQMIDENGSLYPNSGDTTTNIHISGNAFDTAERVSTVSNICCSNYLTGNTNDDAGNYSVKISSVGTCSPVKGMLSFLVGVDTGVTPSIGSAGNTFTFQVVYWGEKAPTSTHLWIDKNRDGTFASNMTGIWNRGSLWKNPQKPWMPHLALVMILIVASAIILLVLASPKAPIIITIVLLFAMGSIPWGIVTGCTGDGTTGDGTTEKLTMTEANSSDANYNDGKLYTVAVALDESGTYNYVFEFKDWNGTDTIGAPTETQTLTVN